MTDFATLGVDPNVARATKLRVSIPYYGAPAADVVLADSTAVPSQSQLVIGDLTMQVAAHRMASFAGSRSARVVGGYGGWAKTLKARDYYSTGNVLLSMVLRDAATEVGERVAIDVDRNLGQKFVRFQAPAGRLLRQLGGELWYIDVAGVTQVGPRKNTALIASDFDLIQWSGKTGQFTIATEKISDWMPGRTFMGRTVSGTYQVQHTSIEQDNDGKLRVVVLGGKLP